MTRNQARKHARQLEDQGIAVRVEHDGYVAGGWRVRRLEERRQRRWRKLGISTDMDEFAALWDEQDGRCRLCQRETEDVVPDHEHATGRVRAALCRHCNLAVGQIEALGLKGNDIIEWAERLRALLAGPEEVERGSPAGP
jgi:hypothetical protein